MKRLLHLYPGEVRARRDLLLRKRAMLLERGVELVLADDWIAPSDRELYADCVEIPPAEQVGEALAALEQYARSHRLDGVLTQTEAALPAGSLLAQACGWPGPSPQGALNCVGKHLTRRALAAAQVAQPEFVLAESAAEVRRFAAAHGFPLMLKACASSMARLVTKVDDDGAIDAAVACVRAGIVVSADVARFETFARAARLDPGADPRTTFLCEAFAPGEPVETDGFVAGGRARSFGVVEQVMTPPPRFFLEAYLLPSDRPDAENDAIRETGERAALAVGLASQPGVANVAGFSIELRAAGATARVIEVNGRLGEDTALHDLFGAASGADPFDLAVALALGDSIDYHTSPMDWGCGRFGRHALVYQCTFGEGIITAVPSEAEVRELNNRTAQRAGLCVRVGDEMHAPPHPECFPHLAWVLVSHLNSSRAAFEIAREKVARLRFGLTSPAS